jgi:hypothetical protein
MHNIHLVPLWSTVPLTLAPSPQSQTPCAGLVLNTFPAFYARSRSSSSWSTKCTLHPEACLSPPSTSSNPICPPIKVLFFGSVAHSDFGRRLRLCEIMTQQVPQFGCFEGVFGSHLNHLINEASIIVLERYYDVSSLETHRVDPLLLKGKVIVSTRSFGQSSILIHAPQ